MSKTTARAAAPQALAHARAKHAKRLKKVERAGARLEQQQCKLAALEAEMARLASQIAEPSGHALGPPSAAKLQRAFVIVNTKAKRLADGTYRLDDIVRELQACGIQAEIGLKTSGKVARRLARTAVARDD